MPWCEPCEAFYNPNTLRADGTCPRCGAQVGDPAAVVTETGAGGDDPSGTSSRGAPDPAEQRMGMAEQDLLDDEELVAKVPWHFWVGVIAMVIYLGWRVIQGVAWFF